MISYKKSRCELHASLRHIMRLCRWAGSFPVEGLNDPYPGRVRFTLTSTYTLYYLSSFICKVYLVISAVYMLHNGKKNTVKNVYLSVFSMLNLTAHVLLYRLAKNWPKLIKAATDIEHSLADVKSRSTVHVKTAVVLSYSFITLGFVEHALSLILAMHLVLSCQGSTETNFAASESFCLTFYVVFFNLLPYSIWICTLSGLVSIQLTFIWNFTDLMGMCFSIYLTAYFQDLEKNINSNKPKDWGKLRARFSRLVVLLNLINKQLAPFILLSSITNLYFICLQLFNTLHAAVRTEAVSYYLFSTLLLTTKALLFAYLAANVHTSANKSVLTLYEVPSSEFNKEVIATIITYELVLLQFTNQVSQDELGHFNNTKVIPFNEI